MGSVASRRRVASSLLRPLHSWPGIRASGRPLPRLLGCRCVAFRRRVDPSLFFLLHSLWVSLLRFVASDFLRLFALSLSVARAFLASSGFLFVAPDFLRLFALSLSVARGSGFSSPLRPVAVRRPGLPGVRWLSLADSSWAL